MTNEERKLRSIELHLGYLNKLVSELKQEMDDGLSVAEQIKAKKTLGLPLTTEEKTYIRISRRLER